MIIKSLINNIYTLSDLLSKKSQLGKIVPLIPSHGSSFFTE